MLIRKEKKTMGQEAALRQYSYRAHGHMDPRGRGRSTKFSELIWAIVYIRRWLKHIRKDDGKRRLRGLGATRSSSPLRRLLSRSDKEIVHLRTGNHSTITTVKIAEKDDRQEVMTDQVMLQQYEHNRHKMAIENREKIITKRGNPHEKVEKHFFERKENLVMRLSRSLRVDGDEEYTENINQLAASSPSGNDISALFRKNIRISQFNPHALDEHEYVQEHVNYLPGTVIYFSSSIALQNSQGHYLNFSKFPDVASDSMSISIYERFLLMNPYDPYDISALHFGDTVVLHSGDYEALGTTFRGAKPLHPSILSCRLREDMPSARWIVLNRNDPHNSLGKVVVNHDDIMLEQEWFFLSSSASQGVKLSKPKTASGSSSYTTGDETAWKVHLIGLPSDNSAEMKHRVRVLQDATKQIIKTKQIAAEKGKKLAEKLTSKLPKELHLDNFIVSTLDYKLYPNLDKANKMRIFNMFSRRDFKSTSTDIVGQIYGFQSNIYKYTQEMLAMRLSKDIGVNSMSATKYGGHERKVDAAKYLSQRITDAEEAYWDSAQELLVDGKAWQELHAMDKYLSHQKQKTVEEAFGFARELVRIDVLSRTRIQEEDELIRRLQIPLPPQGRPADSRGGAAEGGTAAHDLAGGSVDASEVASADRAGSMAMPSIVTPARAPRPRSCRAASKSGHLAAAVEDTPQQRTFGRDKFVDYFQVEDYMLPIPDPTKRPLSVSAMQTKSSAAFRDFASNKLATAGAEADYFRGMTTTGSTRVKSAPSSRADDASAFQKKVDKLFDPTALSATQGSKVGYDAELLRRADGQEYGLPNRSIDKRERSVRLNTKNCLKFLDIVMPNKFSAVKAKRRRGRGGS